MIQKSSLWIDTVIFVVAYQVEHMPWKCEDLNASPQMPCEAWHCSLLLRSHYDCGEVGAANRSPRKLAGSWSDVCFFSVSHREKVTPGVLWLPHMSHGTTPCIQEPIQTHHIQSLSYIGLQSGILCIRCRDVRFFSSSILELFKKKKTNLNILFQTDMCPCGFLGLWNQPG